MDFSEAGWRISRGQALWRAGRNSPEIAAELLVATNTNGQTLVEFTKTPLPLLIAQTTTNSWRIEMISENKSFAGPGAPPGSALWLHLAACVAGTAPPKEVSFSRFGDSRWRLENRRSGETIEGYLLPAP